MVEIPSISRAVIGTEQYVQLPPPDMSIDNARQRLVSFLNARTTAPIILFQNHAADIDARRKAYEAQPFDFTTGTFKSDARAAYTEKINNLVNSLIGKKESSSGKPATGAYREVQLDFEDAEENLDWLVDRQSMLQRSKLFDLEDRWRDDPKISPHLSGDFFL